jgi:hypothetical protein
MLRGHSSGRCTDAQIPSLEDNAQIPSLEDKFDVIYRVVYHVCCNVYNIMRSWWAAETSTATRAMGQRLTFLQKQHHNKV